MKKEDRSPVQQAVRDCLAEWVGEVLADGDIPDEARAGYRDVLDAIQNDDDDMIDEMIAERVAPLADEV